MSKVFFSNSGAEANECAIKAARKYGTDKNPDKDIIITLKNSFHGRTVTTLSATGQEVFHKHFTPFTQGFCHVEANNIEELTGAMSENVCGIMFEIIQGEGGVLPMTSEFISAAEALAEKYDALLIVDEVQTGNGRTGKLYAHQHFGIKPDIFTTAKGLGGGLPYFFPVMYGVAWALDQVYSRIASGRFWSVKTDDYFDLVAWHPYVFTTRDVPDYELFMDVEEPDTLWRDFNDAAYRVMKRYGDADKQVLLTETGFTDCGNPEWEKRYAAYNQKILRLAMEMPYVRTLHNFRLLNENAMLQRAGIEDNQIGGLTEVYFGLFTDPEEGCRPRLRARAIQEMTGAAQDLEALGRKVSETMKK
jgi:hypothetical protein